MTSHIWIQNECRGQSPNSWGAVRWNFNWNEDLVPRQNYPFSPASKWVLLYSNQFDLTWTFSMKWKSTACAIAIAHICTFGSTLSASRIESSFCECNFYETLCRKFYFAKGLVPLIIYSSNRSSCMSGRSFGMHSLQGQSQLNMLVCEHAMNPHSHMEHPPCTHTHHVNMG